eukprot:NODE_2534_length_680_cov_85.637084_g2075_i0.p1 GENE.NODE_2534_length_680_cov_85.637084_g2075_i0~~NODE_2534_length_680_cov_85.637084_g2075_i0.p1  ORF type:complete len:171 (-),score=64.92 NODE_2534_length_680_cov_85.637084_g2075_i0:166-624(-)
MSYVTAADLSREQMVEFKDIFTEYDRDGGGTISTNELGLAMRKAGFHPSPEELISIIADVDQDSSGTIDFSEFLTLMARQQFAGDPESEVKSAFRIFDMDGNGTVSQQELKHVMDSIGTKMKPEELLAMMAELDTDGSGEIDYDEFKFMMAQ